MPMIGHEVECKKYLCLLGEVQRYFLYDKEDLVTLMRENAFFIQKITRSHRGGEGVVAEATHRRRRILRDRIPFYEGHDGSTHFYSKNGKYLI